MQRRQQSGRVKRTWCAWKRSTNPRTDGTDHAKHSIASISNPIHFQSPPGSAAAATSHGDAAIRKPPSIPTAICRRLHRTLWTMFRNEPLFRLGASTERYLQLLSLVLPSRPYHSKTGDANASCQEAWDSATSPRVLRMEGRLRLQEN
jgi:hypothetical protein